MAPRSDRDVNTDLLLVTGGNLCWAQLPAKDGYKEMLVIRVTRSLEYEEFCGSLPRDSTCQ